MAEDTDGKKERFHKQRPVHDYSVTVRKAEMMRMLGIGSTKADELIRTGRVESVLFGRTRLISRQSIEDILSGKPAPAGRQSQDLTGSNAAPAGSESLVAALKFVEDALGTLKDVEVPEIVKAVHLVIAARIKSALAH